MADRSPGIENRGEGRAPRPKANAITARDVAKAAGVSLATVSRVLNGNSAVADALRLTVIEATARLGYTPHAAARALASQRSRIVGAIVPTIENINFAIGVGALQKRLSQAGYTLLLASSNYDPDEELRQARALIAHGAAAIMLVGGAHAPELYEELAARKIPFVNTWVIDQRHPSVGFDNREIGRALANYLLDLGHTEFGVIAQMTGNSDRAADRVAGVREALASRGYALPLERLIERPYKISEGVLALRTLMQSKPRPTAIICGTDVLAFGALAEAERLGISVPRELSVAGINDAEFAAHTHPPLTTVRLPADEIGDRAAEYLLGRVEARLVSPITEVQFNLIVRSSTAPPSAAQHLE